MADTECRGDRKKRKRRRNRRLLVFALSAALVTGRAPAVCAEESGAPQEQTAETPEELSALYAASAVLMDGESGRILFEKNGGEIRPMASTTKIMTCILALEHLPEDTELSVSALAASQPEVRLGMREGETYVLKDLLHSLMLESHNDSAVAIAEAVSGTVEGFAELMNEKAEELGCSGTCFLTPNGLDAEKEEDGKTLVHSTTAADLARIMRYCTMESPEKRTVPADHRNGTLQFFIRRTKLFLRQSQCLSESDGGSVFRQDRIYGQCRILLCRCSGAGRENADRGASGMRMAQQ